MKRPKSSDSLGALMALSPNSPDAEERVNNNHQETNAMYALMDGDCVEESLGHHHRHHHHHHHYVSEKKRRLSDEQVKALEKNFDVDNKLEPERKAKLARELGLQPRQVAVWFQNRRARWKTKNLEGDYGVLRSNYDALEQEFEALKRDNESLLKEIQELKSQLASVNQDPFSAEANDDEEGGKEEEVEAIHVGFLTTTKDRQSDNELNFDGDSCNELNANDSDSSALLNDDDNNNNYGATADLEHRKLIMEIRSGSSSSSMGSNSLEDSKRAYQPQFVKIEEHDFSASFFDDEQAPTLNWYGPDEWD